MLPQDLKYTKSHEWIHCNSDEIAKIGITYYAQENLGNITFVELPDVGASLNRGQPFGVIESVKAASDLYMPVSGEIVAIRRVLRNHQRLPVGSLRLKCTISENFKIYSPPKNTNNYYKPEFGIRKR